MDPAILDRDVQYVKGVGPKRAEILRSRLGLRTLRDLVEYAPRDYLDFSRFVRIRDLVPDQPATVEAQVVTIHKHQPLRRPNLAIVTAVVTDGTGHARAVWFGQPWLEKALPPGTVVVLSGRPQRERGTLEFHNPLWEVLGEDSELLHAGRILPVYRLTEGIKAAEMRRIMRQAVELAAPHMPDLVPEEIRQRRRLLPAAVAWRGVHWPGSRQELAEALRTVKYQELFVMQVGLAMLRARLAAKQGIAHGPGGPRCARFRQALPFTLTQAQERAIAEIWRDMERPEPMNRLLQGDVGSGKTVVAAAAVVKAIDSGHQACLMAPTEILAEQHYFGLRRILEPLGVQVVLLTGSRSKRERDEALQMLRTRPDVLAVGTHALIEPQVEFGDLSLVVIDEQHRFGVAQRMRLQHKRRDGRFPDVLVMTATPIPRTVAMTLFGDLDLTRMDEKPPGRQEIVTVWRKPQAREHVYETLVNEFVARGQQAYVIAPLVEESDRLEAQAATQLYEELQAKFPQVRFGLMHGRLKPEEKEAVMAAFRQGEVQVLVATTVVEVGVDVPNATVIVIEEADRFGLAQLHQLRGRVGRGSQKSYCVLIADPKTPEGVQRMQSMQRLSSGFALAEEDLRLRGPGEYLGTAQSGWGLQFADLIQDRELLEEARADAQELVASGGLARHPGLLKTVEARWGDRLGLALVG